MTENNYLLEFARKELELINFDKSELHEPILNLLETMIKVCNNNPSVMKQIANIIPLLVEKKPLSPITEDDFELEYFSENDITMYRCTRHPYIYKTEDGKYWNDRAIAFRFEDEPDTNKMYLYQCGNNSKQEIELPYYPSEVVKIIEKN